MRFLILLAALLPATAMAQEAAVPTTPSPIAGMLPLVLIFLVMYMIVIRPQKKRMQEHEAMVKAVKKGDTVLTNGGIIGRITSVSDENTLTVEIASGVEVKVARNMLSNVLDKDGKPIVVAKPEKAGKNDNVKASSKNVANDN
jgi:preprotein translocase subunit YajC